jgi:diguanylate cyclase (GGDEF)-like protein/PAS domain S-box-containing protein
MLSEDAKTLMNYLNVLLNNEQAPDEVPKAFVADPDFQALDATIRSLRQVAQCRRADDLSEDIAGKGYVLESMNRFQNDFKAFITHAIAVISEEVAVDARPIFDDTRVFDSLSRLLEFSVRKLKELNENFETIFQNIPDAIAITRMDDWTILEVNQPFLDLTDYTRAEILHKQLKNFNLGISDAEFIGAYHEFDTGDNYKNIETTYRNRYNQERIWNISLKVVNIGGTKCMLTMIRDVTELKALQNKLVESEKRHRLLADYANDIISTIDLAGNFTYISPAVERITGYTVDEVMNHFLEIHYFTPEMLKVMDRITTIVSRLVITDEPLEPIRFEQLQYRKDGRAIWTDTILTGIYDEDGHLSELLGVTRDITEKVRLRDQIQKLSETDKLTRLYNRVKLDDALLKAFERALKTGEAFSMIMLDVDFFKRINDQFGHQAGDAMLVELAEILQHSIRSRDIVGRWGGEEFLFILPETNEKGAMVVADKIRAAVGKHRFARPERVTVSLGVSTYRGGDSAPDVIVARADQALYEAKRRGRNQVQLL